MGRKRKTRWRRLSIGEISANEEEDVEGSIVVGGTLTPPNSYHRTDRHSTDLNGDDSHPISGSGNNSNSGGPKATLGDQSAGSSPANMMTTTTHSSSSASSVNSQQQNNHHYHSNHTNNYSSSHYNNPRSYHGGGDRGGNHYHNPQHHHNNHYQHHNGQNQQSHNPPGTTGKDTASGNGSGGSGGNYNGHYQNNYYGRHNYNNYRNNPHHYNSHHNGGGNASGGQNNGANEAGSGSGGGSNYQSSDYHYPSSRGYHGGGGGRFRKPRPYSSSYYYSNGGTASGQNTQSSAGQNEDGPNRPSYNQEEYTKITTPRQDVLFKKGYLSQKKSGCSVESTSATTTPSASTNGTPDTQSTNGVHSDYSEGYENGETDCGVAYDDTVYYGPPSTTEAVFTDPNTGQVFYGHCSAGGEYYDAYPMAMVAGYPAAPVYYHYDLRYQPLDWNGVPTPMYPVLPMLEEHLITHPSYKGVEPMEIVHAPPHLPHMSGGHAISIDPVLSKSTETGSSSGEPEIPSTAVKSTAMDTTEESSSTTITSTGSNSTSTSQTIAVATATAVSMSMSAVTSTAPSGVLSTVLVPALAPPPVHQFAHHPHPHHPPGHHMVAIHPPHHQMPVTTSTAAIGGSGPGTTFIPATASSHHANSHAMPGIHQQHHLNSVPGPFLYTHPPAGFYGLLNGGVVVPIGGPAVSNSSLEISSANSRKKRKKRRRKKDGQLTDEGSDETGDEDRGEDPQQVEVDNEKSLEEQVKEEKKNEDKETEEKTIPINQSPKKIENVLTLEEVCSSIVAKQSAKDDVPVPPQSSSTLLPLEKQVQEDNTLDSNDKFDETLVAQSVLTTDTTPPLSPPKDKNKNHTMESSSQKQQQLPPSFEHPAVEMEKVCEHVKTIKNLNARLSSDNLDETPLAVTAVDEIKVTTLPGLTNVSLEDDKLSTGSTISNPPPSETDNGQQEETSADENSNDNSKNNGNATTDQNQNQNQAESSSSSTTTTVEPSSSIPRSEQLMSADSVEKVDDGYDEEEEEDKDENSQENSPLRSIPVGSKRSINKPADLNVLFPMSDPVSDIQFQLQRSPDGFANEPSSPDSFNTNQSVAGSEVAVGDTLSMSETDLLHRTTSIDEVEEDLPHENYYEPNTLPNSSSVQFFSNNENSASGSGNSDDIIVPEPTVVEPDCNLENEQPEPLTENVITEAAASKDDSPQKPELKDLYLLSSSEETTTVTEIKGEEEIKNDDDDDDQNFHDKVSSLVMDQQDLIIETHEEKPEPLDVESYVDYTTTTAQFEPELKSDDLESEQPLPERPKSIGLTLAVSDWLKRQGDDALTPIGIISSDDNELTQDDDEVDDGDDEDDEGTDGQTSSSAVQKNAYGSHWQSATSNRITSRTRRMYLPITSKRFAEFKGYQALKSSKKNTTAQTSSCAVIEDMSQTRTKPMPMAAPASTPETTMTTTKSFNDKPNEKKLSTAKKHGNKRGESSNQGEKLNIKIPNYDSGFELSSPENGHEKNQIGIPTMTAGLTINSSNNSGGGETSLLLKTLKKKCQGKNCNLNQTTQTSNGQTGLDRGNSSPPADCSVGDSLVVDEIQISQEFCNPKKFTKYYQLGIVFDEDQSSITPQDDDVDCSQVSMLDDEMSLKNPSVLVEQHDGNNSRKDNVVVVVNNASKVGEGQGKTTNHINEEGQSTKSKVSSGKLINNFENFNHVMLVGQKGNENENEESFKTILSSCCCDVDTKLEPSKDLKIGGATNPNEMVEYNKVIQVGRSQHCCVQDEKEPACIESQILPEIDEEEDFAGVVGDKSISLYVNPMSLAAELASNDHDKTGISMENKTSSTTTTTTSDDEEIPEYFSPTDAVDDTWGDNSGSRIFAQVGQSKLIRRRLEIAAAQGQNIPCAICCCVQ